MTRILGSMKIYISIISDSPCAFGQYVFKIIMQVMNSVRAQIFNTHTVHFKHTV